MANTDRKSQRKISPRLEAAFDHLLKDDEVWDFCCDHGLLGIKALKSNEFRSVHFIDQVPHIMQALKEKILRFRVAPMTRYFLHCCDGANITSHVNGTAVIAGVGGDTILEILKSLQTKKLLQAQRIILIPHKDEKHMKAQLSCDSEFAQTFLLANEIAVTERERLRQVLVFDRRF